MITKTITEVNQQAIDKELEQLDKVVPYVQKVYDSFNSAGIPVKLEDINSIIGWSMDSPGCQQMDELVTERLLELPENKKLIGLSPSEIRSQMKIPNWLNITNDISKKPLEGYQYGRGISVEFLQVARGKVIKMPGADKLIKEKHTKSTLVPDYKAINGKR